MQTEIIFAILGAILIIVIIYLSFSLIRVADSVRRVLPAFEEAVRSANKTLIESEKTIVQINEAAARAQKVIEDANQTVLKTNTFMDQTLPKVNKLIDDIQTKSNKLDLSINEISRVSYRVSQINEQLDRFVMPVINNFSGLADTFEEKIKEFQSKRAAKKEQLKEEEEVEENSFENEYVISRKDKNE